MSRIAAVEHQESAYKHAQNIAAEANRAKSQLTYDNGKLQVSCSHALIQLVSP